MCLAGHQGHNTNKYFCGLVVKTEEPKTEERADPHVRAGSYNFLERWRSYNLGPN